MKTVVKKILSADKGRKVEVFRREDGSFGFDELHFSSVPNEQSWISVGKYSQCVAPDLSTAEKEARGRVEWLSETSGEG